MADIFDFYVYDDRSIKFNLAEPIMQEDCNVTALRFRIPYFLNNIDMHNWAWWLVYTNAGKQKFSEPLTLASDTDDPDSYNTAIYNVGYGMTLNSGNISFALEAIKTDAGGNITGEWHTYTYNLSVVSTLQGNQAQFEGTEEDIISALVRDTITKIDVTNSKIAEISESIASGTNLLNPESIATGTVNGVNITKEDDAVIFDGNATADGFAELSRDLNLEAGKQYAIKVYTSSNKQIQYQLSYSGDSIEASPIWTSLNRAYTFTVPAGDIARLRIGTVSGVEYSNDEYRFSIMEGSTNPSYEKYTGDTSAIDIVARRAQAVIPNGAVTTAKLAGGSVTEAKLASGSVSSDKVQDGSITEAKLADALKLKTIKDYVTPEMFGAKGDGSTDDTQAFVDMFADSANKNVYIPTGRYKITSTITINNAVRIFGDGFARSVIIFAGVGTAFSINAHYVTFESIRLYNITYYTDTVNSNTGIEANGTNENHYYGLQIINCDIKGFQTNIYIHYGWSCKIIGTNSNYCLYGIRVNGLSVNSEIDSCHFTTTYNTLTKENNSIGIYFEGGVASEGWRIVNCLTYGFVIGVLLEDITHCIIANNIFDFCYQTGIELRGTNYFSGNHYINNNYIAISSSGDFAEKNGIATSVNKSSTQYRGNSIVGNLIVCYATNTSLYATYGIKLITSPDQKSSIIGNHIYHCNTGVRVACYSTIVIGNIAVDCDKNGFYVDINGNVTNVDLMPIVANNQGTVYKSLNNKSRIMDRNIMMKNNPFNGVKDGDVILASSASSSGTLGWVCVNSVAGQFKPILLGDVVTVS